MKRIFILLLSALSFLFLPAQSLFESALDLPTTANEQTTKLSLGGFVRGSVYGGAKNYDLTSTFAELALKTRFDKGKAFLESDIRLRKAVFFDENVQMIQLKELYAGYRGEKLDVLLGNQIVSWGRADGFNPTNNITPNDYFFLSADPDDQKESNFMLRMKLRFIPAVELELIGIPFYQASNYRYDLFDMGENVAFGSEIIPSKDLKNGTLAARLNFEFPVAGWSLSYFRGYDPYHGFDVQSVDWSTGLPLLTNVAVSYLKTTAGADFAIPIGKSVFRGEVAYNITKTIDNKMYIPLPDVSYVAEIESNLAGFTMVGQYIGKFVPDFSALVFPVLSDPLNSTAQMQYTNELIDYENRLFNRRIFNQQEKTNHAVSLTVNKSFGYDNWNAECTAYFNFTSDEWLIRPKLIWKINDNLSAAIGGNYMQGKVKTLFGYSSTVMNGGFAELRVTF
ncbi:MAG: hypothetical protein LLF95_04040 [Bacteroidales bacterium]|nr:hypothetical protein [Bacteroidales bacterium]